MSLDLNLIYSDFNFTMDKSSRHKIYEFEKFRLDTAHLMLYRGAEEISLAPKAVETLLVLVERRGEIVHKDELMETIWTDSIVEESNLAKYLHVLRKTLGNQQNGKPFIETYRRRGYRFNGEVKVGSSEIKQENTIQNFAPHPTISGAIREATTGKVVVLADWQHKSEADARTSPNDLPADQTAEYSTRKIKSRQLGFVVGLIFLLLASIGLGSWFFANRASNAGAIESIAVLPFENADGDADLDYLSDGLSEGLIDRLSELPQLKVIARSSSFKYRGENIDVQDAARKLGVQTIVIGRVGRRGDDLSIRVELIDARDNKQLWGEQFNRKAADALTIQREIAQTISRKLRLKLTGAQEQQLATRGTDNPQAYELLLKGDFLINKNIKGNTRKAIEYYNQAISLDPNYALAYARLSRRYQAYANNGVFDPKEMLPKARAAAQKAVELDENLAEAHLELANLALNDWDWKTAEREYQRTLELNPNLVAAHQSYSLYLGIMGQHEQAIDEAYRVRELDPQRLSSRSTAPFALLIARRFDESISENKKILELDQNYVPAYLVLGYAYTGKTMYREAVAAYQEAKRLGKNDLSLDIYLGTAYAGAGERGKAQAILKQLETSKEYVSSGELAILYAALDERDKAFESLEKAFAVHDLQLQYLKADPGFDSLHDDPRFQDLLRRVGLPQ